MALVQTVIGENRWIRTNEVSPKLPVELKSTPGQRSTPEGMTDEVAEKARLDRERRGLGIQPAARG